MNKYFKSFKYFFYVQNFFKTRKIYSIFFLFTLVTIIEMINIGIILPFLNLVFNPETVNLQNNEFLKYLNIQNYFSGDNFIYVLIVIILTLFIIKSLILVVAARMQTNFFAMMRTKITTYFFNLYISKPYIYYLNEKDSSKIMRNVTMLSSNYTGFLERFLLLANDFFIFIGVIIVLFIYEPVVSSIVFITIFIFSYIFTHLTKKYFFSLGQSLLSLSSDLLKDIQEALDNILQIKLLKKTFFFKKQFGLKAESNSNKIGKISFLQSLPKIFTEFIAVVLLLSIIFYLIFFEKSQEEILIILTLFAFAAMRIIPVANKFISFLNTLSNFTPSLDLLYTELNKEKVKNSNYFEYESKKIDDIESINIKDVSFSYENRKNSILEKINLSFSKGNIYGLVGETGSGKTTLLNILTGLIKPSNGQVKYNNSEINNKSYRKISYVSQDTYLQSSTIKNNIAFGCDEIDIDFIKIKSCLKQAQLDQLIYNLPDGIETNISELGANFSGGQIQRLSIARALYADSSLIIFDEPTSSLDEDTTNAILNMISKIKKNRIIIMITHEKKDLNICDKIFKIENKKIVEFDEKKIK